MTLIIQCAQRLSERANGVLSTEHGWICLKGVTVKYTRRSFQLIKMCMLAKSGTPFQASKFGWKLKIGKVKQLDKDLLVQGNKVHSPETCVFVSCQVNSFLLENLARQGDFPTGVCYQRGKYKAQCKNLGSGLSYLGLYNTPEEAQSAYWNYKCSLAIELSKEQTDQRVADRLLEIYKEV